jgi:hypothetical protein
LIFSLLGFFDFLKTLIFVEARVAAVERLENHEEEEPEVLGHLVVVSAFLFLVSSIRYKYIYIYFFM